MALSCLCRSITSRCRLSAWSWPGLHHRGDGGGIEQVVGGRGQRRQQSIEPAGELVRLGGEHGAAIMRMSSAMRATIRAAPGTRQDCPDHARTSPATACRGPDRRYRRRYARASAWPPAARDASAWASAICSREKAYFTRSFAASAALSAAAGCNPVSPMRPKSASSWALLMGLKCSPDRTGPA